MNNKILYVVIAFAVVIGVAGVLMNKLTPVAEAPTEEAVVCSADVMECLEGTVVGRSGPDCEFICPALPTVPADLQAHIDSKNDIIKVAFPIPMGVIESPLKMEGAARGNWFFEASAPVILTDWDGLIIAEGIITAEGDWMTTEFVLFEGELEFTSPYKEGDPDFMKRGSLIFKKDNPSGLPENDDAMEFTVWFAK